MFTKFNSHPHYSSRFSVCQQGLVELRELCRYAQNYRGGIVFYDRFLYLCNLRGVSPSRAAVDAGISKSLVTKWKSNNIEVPSPDVLKKLAKYFSIPVSELLGEETEKAPAETGKRKVSDEDIMFALFRGREGITEEMYEEVRKFADYVALREEQKKRKEG